MNATSKRFNFVRVYSFPSIQLNHREVLLDAILRQSIQFKNDTEQPAVEFIKDWISGKEMFAFQTSGSTGTPKQFTFARWQLQQSAARTVKALGLTAGDQALVCLNTRYVAGKMMLVRALKHNLGLTIIDPTANPFETLPTGYQPDFMAVVPLQLATLSENPENHPRLNQMKAILVGGAPVSLSTVNKLQELKCPIYETYGMTETLSNIAIRLINTPSKSHRFTPLEHVQVRTDQRSCLVIHDSIQKEPLITNDIGEVHSNGTFTWLGRFDNVINTGGIKVHPEKIEQVLEELLSQFKFTLNYFVGPLPDDRFGQIVTLFIDKNELLPENIDSILAKINSLPSSPEKPKKIALARNWRLTETGKTDRKRIISTVSGSAAELLTLS
ncbi:MAG: AMP-binding protein [Cyclobacteriaceae bacterium]|nr:AMP-binding protein [Cyclobacteriaceae bacterium]